MTTIRHDLRWVVAMALACFALLAPPVDGQAAARPPAPLTAAQKKAILRNPAHPFWRTRAPDTAVFDVTTSKGTMTLELIREWAPHGVDRFYNLARAGFYDDTRVYRVVVFFIAQFGIAADPLVNNTWGSRKLPVDSVRTSNVRGTVSFAQYNPGNRTTNVFINLNQNAGLDTLGFAPIGRITQGMEVADSLYPGYGEMPASPAPLGNPRRLYAETNRYLDAEFPKLDRIVSVVLRPTTGGSSELMKPEQHGKHE